MAGAPLAWAAREPSKPGRAAAERWVLHASPAWSREHLEDDADGVARSLLADFFAFSGPLLDDLDFHIVDRIVDGEWAAVVWEETARVAATGEPWENHGVDVFRVVDDSITVLHENNDTRLVHTHLPRYPGR